jgi:rubrerythrin
MTATGELHEEAIMEAAAQQMADALFEAIKAEREGAHFYLMAARSTQDQKGRETFERLAHEEEAHERFLAAHYQSLLKTGHLDVQAKLGRQAPLTEESPIFSAGIKKRVQEAHFEMSALAIGIRLEAAAMKFYRDHAASAADANLRKFFEELVEWESGHYQALLRQQEALKEDYWASAGFSPF